ncbi:uncharacterized protein LOC126880839 [Diabrotica virgifera virgifera]|uniref:Uncharacterized protein n=1 Tax=Diabrotica virgifera virgifera TaxID=50390 RepID=A0ABM5JSF1_DIAVI|nr:uncharacterized protein LOC126880839 [Diabrotica virgifera virgifera]
MADGRRSVSKTTQGEEQKEEKSDLEKFMELILTKMEENNNKIETKLIHLDENNKKMRIKLDETSQKAEGNKNSQKAEENNKSVEQKLEENSKKSERNNKLLEQRLGEKLEETLEKMEYELEETSKRLEEQIEQRVSRSIGEVKMLYEEMMNKHETLETKLTSENQEIIIQIQQHKERINMVEEDMEKEAEWTNKRFMMVDENINEIKKEQKTSKEKEDQLENKWKIEVKEVKQEIEKMEKKIRNTTKGTIIHTIETSDNRIYFNGDYKSQHPVPFIKILMTKYLQMHADDKNIIAKKDPLICQYTYSYIKGRQSKGNMDLVRKNMRRLAKLLHFARLKNPEIKKLVGILRLKNFQLIISGVNKLAKYNPETENYESPTLAINFGTFIKKSCDLADINLVQIEDTSDERKDLKILKNLIESQWCN